MQAGRSFSFRHAVLALVAVAGLSVVLVSLTYDPTVSELTAKVANLELQLQHLKASYHAAAPRDSIVHLKSHMTELQNKIEKHESLLELSERFAPNNELDAKQRQVIIESAQREIQILREEIKTLQAAYTQLEQQNALEHANLVDEHKELEQLNQQQHKDGAIHENDNKNNDESTNNKHGIKSYPTLGLDTVLLVICHNRADYLSKTLDFVAKYHPKTSVPIVISQDGTDASVTATINHFQGVFQEAAPLVPVVHIRHTKSVRRGPGDGYAMLADHFKFALEAVFMPPGQRKIPDVIPEVSRVIILEEDLELAPDFFEFFAAVAPMVDRDDSILAASAWNDNGMKGFVRDPSALYRSDFFPGLGWMMSRKVWEELAPKWPAAYWDDWLREPAQRKGRHIIRPEVCRTYHFGIKGTSNMQYSKFLTDIQKNEEFVPFTTLDLTYLEKAKWDDAYITQVRNAPLVSVADVLEKRALRKEVRIEYATLRDFEDLARRLGIMDNIKANVPRTAYRGVVSFWKNDYKVHLSPADL